MPGPHEQPEFIHGLELAEGFYHDAVKPILETGFPGLWHSAALIGYGSEVLGYDTPMSRDHHWGPGLMLFLEPDELSSRGDTIRRYLSENLPVSYRGYPTNYSEPNPEDNGVQLLQPVTSCPVNHRVELLTVAGFFTDYLGIDIHTELGPADWLTLPQQKLLGVTSGAVFHDDLGLEEICGRLAWYPHDVWLYLMAACWQRIGQEEHLMGRAGIEGDEIGSSISGARLVRDCIRLAFFIEKKYPPYAKWLGTAFHKLDAALYLERGLLAALQASSWRERERHLCTAYEALAALHNKLNLTPLLPEKVSQFWGRPFFIIKGDTFTAALLREIKDPAIRAMNLRSPIGNIDLFSDNTDLLEDPLFRRDIRRLFE